MVITGLPGRQGVAPAEVGVTSMVSSADLTQLLEAVARVLGGLGLHLRLVMTWTQSLTGAGLSLDEAGAGVCGGVAQGGRQAEAEVLGALLVPELGGPGQLIGLELGQAGAH